MRAAAFAQGSLEALRTVKTPEGDLLDDVSIISSVSGSSLTAAYYGLYGRDGLGRFRSDVRVPGFESGLRLSLANPGNIVRMSSGGLNVREDFVDVLNRKAFRGATFTDLYRHPHVDFPRDAALQRSDQGRNVNRRASLSRRGRGELA